jgi:anti-sigma regulatory factor (Ser/Thr protein kinase)
MTSHSRVPGQQQPEGAGSDASVPPVVVVSSPEQPPPSARLELPGTAESVRAARAFLTTLLRSWSVRDETVDDAALLLSEVAGNAVRHGAGDMALEVRREEGMLRVEVHDEAYALPRLLDSETHQDAEGGRGMWLVDAIAERWDTRRTERGKAVWFELALA